MIHYIMMRQAGVLFIIIGLFAAPSWAQDDDELTPLTEIKKCPAGQIRFCKREGDSISVPSPLLLKGAGCQVFINKGRIYDSEKVYLGLEHTQGTEWIEVSDREQCFQTVRGITGDFSAPLEWDKPDAPIMSRKNKGSSSQADFVLRGKGNMVSGARTFVDIGCELSDNEPRIYTELGPDCLPKEKGAVGFKIKGLAHFSAKIPLNGNQTGKPSYRICDPTDKVCLDLQKSRATSSAKIDQGWSFKRAFKSLTNWSGQVGPTTVDAD